MLAADSEVLLDGSDFQDYVFVSVCVWDRDISLVSGFDLTDTLVPGGVAGCQPSSPAPLPERETWLGWRGDERDALGLALRVAHSRSLGGLDIHMI